MQEAWINGLLGGLCIGLAASLLLLFNGRVSGISGILSGAIFDKVDRLWRCLFLLGLPLGALIYAQLFGMPEISVSSDLVRLMVAGLLVGVGTRIGSGCTSGHGVCGIARLSARSILATCLFMLTAMITVYFMKGGR